MSYLQIAICVLCLTVPATLLLLRRRKMMNVEPASPDWLAEFSLDKYKPMERLLCDADYEFLSSQSGFEPSIARKLRRERRRIYRKYLRRLGEDFDCLHRTAMALALTSPEDRPEFTALLARLKLNFHVAMMQVRVQFFLNGLGIGTVPTLSVLDALRNLSEAANTIRMSTATAGL